MLDHKEEVMDLRLFLAGLKICPETTIQTRESMVREAQEGLFLTLLGNQIIICPMSKLLSQFKMEVPLRLSPPPPVMRRQSMGFSRASTIVLVKQPMSTRDWRNSFPTTKAS